jgi:hypothetical protein
MAASRPSHRLGWLAAVILLWAGMAGIGLSAPATPAVSLPVRVHISVRIVDILKIQETTGETSAMLELSASWQDPALAFDPIAAGANRKDYLEGDAQALLARIWRPDLTIENGIGDFRRDIASVSIFANGNITVIRRIEGDFRVLYDLSAFPFDVQTLRFPIVSKQHPADEVIFVIDDRDRALSTLSERLTAQDWEAGKIGFQMEQFYGWNARPFMRVVAIATVERAWPRYFLRIFVPFLAVISVSLFILWAPRGFVGDRPSITYSALLALAALSFTFEASFPGSMSVTSPIAYMISLGYFYLIFTLVIDLVLEAKHFPLRHAYPDLAVEARRYLRFVLPAIFAIVCVTTVLRSLA